MGMGIDMISERQVNDLCVRGLGLDAESLDLSAPEALAAAIRRAASFLCPATPNQLVSAVEDSLASVVVLGAGVEVVAEMLAALTGYGDLLELDGFSDDPRSARTQLYLAPPSFVPRRSGAFLLFGIRPDASPLLGDTLLPAVECERHVRRIPAAAKVDLNSLLEYGLRELPESIWVSAPEVQSPDQMRRQYDTLLAKAGPSGAIEGITVLDSDMPTRYYKGRWRAPTSKDSGNFIARRPQAYGAHLWCYALISSGVVTKAIDLPSDTGSLVRGCDAAWHLQAALDAVAGHPQVLRLRPSPAHGRTLFELFSPPPSWLQRRWDVLGTPVLSRGALTAYLIDDGESAQEADYAARTLWVDVVRESN